ncbi:hypothetical protein HPB48_004442 [Haemaphysalis longicornis]|uniref:Reverse transcriptase domain-containing protein n=1 Tax=Haemaphysalis longicornis TaxID=44386 RepID=A0A9J6FX28_HAELO|nr:hypothetical protein HPB48_004442 [Haemaphysalis longicornis]
MLPSKMLGLRKNLSTQEALLRIHEEIHKESRVVQLKAILAIQLKSQFHHIDYDAMLESLGSTNCECRMYGYVRNFLQDRQVTLGIRDHLSAPFSHPQRGIPQGSVFSPSVFILPMLIVHSKNSRFLTKFSLYADNIILYITKRSPGHIQETVLLALKEVDGHHPT